ncbi:MAG TPA: outer membrane protein assembly factor BamD [Acidobacteriota bacterium]|jgi:outer membrane protein assembly factor BamD|nr:outer membrane protein assembly factor BamD [Acidobacteriota bacterium]
MKRRLCFPALILALLLAGCHHQKSANLQKGSVPPDRVLYQNGAKYLQKGQYIKARLSFQTLISTYPESEFTPKSVMAIGDSYYEEGGSANLLQAEAQYRDYILFYPNYEDADDAQMKIAALNYKMMRGAENDQTYTRKAEVELKRMLQNFPNSELVPTAKEMLRDVQQRLAKSEEVVGDFYLRQHKNLLAAESRFKVALEKDPHYPHKDEIYFKLAETQEKQGRITEAVYYYSQIIIGFPFSDKYEAAKKRLILLEQPVPPTDPVKAAENEKNREIRDFSIWDPFRDIWSVFSGKEDPYERAKRAAATRAAREGQLEKKNGGNGNNKEKKPETK